MSEQRMLRIEQRNAETPIERKPEWIRTRARTGPEFLQIQAKVKGQGLHTVCQEAQCPNIFECWEDREATFLIGGSQCSRRCDFCTIDHGRPDPLDRAEPQRVAETVREMGLQYATITGVTRDDLEDEGVWLYAETVPRIFKRIRPAFSYERSLDVITQARAAGLVTKSNLILGMGEEIEEVHQALRDLVAAGCELVTITQYLRPSTRHHPIARWVKPEEFVALADFAREAGFSGVMSGPLVRSSYRAGNLYRQAIAARERGEQATITVGV